MKPDHELPAFTAKCRTLRDELGYRLTFFCEVCGRGYDTPPIVCDSLKEALRLGEKDARLHFNRCGGCHRWVCDEHFNENQMMCTDCAPRVCTRCKAPIPTGADLCIACGASQYGTERDEGI